MHSDELLSGGYALNVLLNGDALPIAYHPFEVYAMGLANGNAVITAIETDFQAFLKKR